MPREVVIGYDNKPRIHPEITNPLLERNIKAAKHVARATNNRYLETINPDQLDKLNSNSNPSNTLWMPFDTLGIEEALKIGAITEQLAKLIQEESITPRKALELFKYNPEIKPHLIAGGIADPPKGTKLVVHPLLNEQSIRPKFWTPEIDKIPKSLTELTLFGITSFSTEDLRIGTKQVLNHLQGGKARIKLGNESGGKGQWVVNNDKDSLESAIQEIQQQLEKECLQLLNVGAGIEDNLDDNFALSMGELYMSGRLISYIGIMHQIKIGEMRYFTGSDRVGLEGPLEKLIEKLALPVPLKDALIKARKYEDRLTESKGILTMRTNYNYLLAARSGFVEHTFRPGGAMIPETEIWLAAKKYPDSPTIASTRQSYLLRGDRIQAELSPARTTQTKEKIIFSYQNSRTKKLSSQPIQDNHDELPTLIDTFARIILNQSYLLDDEDAVKQLLLRHEKIIYTRV